MEPKIKIDLPLILQSSAPVVLDLGCGQRKAAGRIGIDALDLPDIDIVADLNKGFPFLPDQSVDAMFSNSLIEHIDNFEHFLRETLRVLKPHGRSHLFVPHFSNPYYYSDYTHSKFFGLYTFHYFVDPRNQLKRKVPTFYTDIRIELISQSYVFSSPFRGRRLVKRALGSLFNSCDYMKEFYEENLCYVFPCYGMNIVFGPKNTLEIRKENE